MTDDDAMIAKTDALASFLKFADQMAEIREHYDRPAYAETCTSGATVEVGRSVDRAEQARIRRHFQGRHFRCGGTDQGEVTGDE